MSTDSDPQTQPDAAPQESLPDSTGGALSEEQRGDHRAQIVWLRALAERLVAQAQRIEMRIKTVLGQREE